METNIINAGSSFIPYTNILLECISVSSELHCDYQQTSSDPPPHGHEALLSPNDFGFVEANHHNATGAPPATSRIRIGSSAGNMTPIQTRRRAQLVDNFSRTLFPACFLAFNLIYWLVYYYSGSHPT